MRKHTDKKRKIEKVDNAKISPPKKRKKTKDNQENGDISNTTTVNNDDTKIDLSSISIDVSTPVKKQKPSCIIVPKDLFTEKTQPIYVRIGKLWQTIAWFFAACEKTNTMVFIKKRVETRIPKISEALNILCDVTRGQQRRSLCKELMGDIWFSHLNHMIINFFRYKTDVSNYIYPISIPRKRIVTDSIIDGLGISVSPQSNKQIDDEYNDDNSVIEINHFPYGISLNPNVIKGISGLIFQFAELFSKTEYTSNKSIISAIDIGLVNTDQCGSEFIDFVIYIFSWMFVIPSNNKK